jgi:hypothetical protein
MYICIRVCTCVCMQQYLLRFVHKSKFSCSTSHKPELSIIGFSMLEYCLFYIFSPFLFNDPVSNSGYIASNVRIILNDDLEGMWKELVMA